MVKAADATLCGRSRHIRGGLENCAESHHLTRGTDNEHFYQKFPTSLNREKVGRGKYSSAWSKSGELYGMLFAKIESAVSGPGSSWFVPIATDAAGRVSAVSGNGQMPAQFVETASLWIFLTRNDELVLLNGDRALWLETNVRPKALGNERPGKPIHGKAEVVKLTQVDICANRSASNEARTP